MNNPYDLFNEWHQTWVDGILHQWEQRRLNPQEDELPPVKKHGLPLPEDGELQEPPENQQHDNHFQTKNQ